MLGRYGNWAGAAYGQGHLSPALNFATYDVSTATGLAAYRAALSKFKPGGEVLRESQHRRPRFLRRGRARCADLLYQAANLKAAQGPEQAGLAYQRGEISSRSSRPRRPR